jgi:adenylate cyclase
MAETRKLAAILAADVVGYSRLAGSDEDRTLARLRGLRSDLIDPVIAAHHGRTVKRTGDGVLIEFEAVSHQIAVALFDPKVDADPKLRCAALVAGRRCARSCRSASRWRSARHRPRFCNIAARLEGIADPGGICLSEDAYRQVRDRLKEDFTDLGEKVLKNIARAVRVYAIKTGTAPSTPQASAPEKAGPPRLSIVVLPFANLGGDPAKDYIADVITEELTTNLSRIAGSFVIARSTDDEREQIGLAKAVGHSIGAIAKAIGRPRSTVSRELLRNRLPSGRYSLLHAAGAYQLRRRRD